MTGRSRATIVALVALVAASSCSPEADVPSTTSPSTRTQQSPTSTTVTTTTTVAIEDDALVLGALIPMSGAYSHLSGAIAGGVRLAVEDVDAAGGVFGSSVSLLETDSGDSASTAMDAVDELLGRHVDAIIGAPSSAGSLAILETTVADRVILFSASNSAPELSLADDDGLYFRTSASDALQGAALGMAIMESAPAGPVAIVYRRGHFGEAIEARLADALDGLEVESLPYDTEEDLVEISSEDLVRIDPEVVVVIGLEEVAGLVSGLHEHGLGPADRTMWVVDPTFAALGGLVDDPSVLSGLRGLRHQIVPENLTSFIDRVEVAGDEGMVFAFAAEAYDAVVITALAALTAGVDDPVSIAAEIPDVTRGGEPCTTFEACAALIAEQVDIDYDGLAGRYEFTDDGEPSVVSFEWARYEDGRLTAPLGMLTLE